MLLKVEEGGGFLRRSVVFPAPGASEAMDDGEDFKCCCGSAEIEEVEKDFVKMNRQMEMLAMKRMRRCSFRIVLLFYGKLLSLEN